MPMIGSTYYGSSTIKSNTGSNGSQNTVDSTAALGFQGTLISAGKSAADLKPIDVAELPEDRYQSYMDGEQLRLAANKRYLESQYTDRSWTDTVEASLEAFPLADTPATQPYATVVVGGKVVATIDNQGVVASDDELGQKLQGILQGDVDGANGPDLAQARAEQIAELLGGEVRKVDTAMTQSQFNASPSNEQLRPSLDDEAMKSDPLYDQLQSMFARLEGLTQQRQEHLAQQRADVETPV